MGIELRLCVAWRRSGSLTHLNTAMRPFKLVVLPEFKEDCYHCYFNIIIRNSLRQGRLPSLKLGDG